MSGIPGLTDEQIEKLVKLASTSNDVVKNQKEMTALRSQLEEMMKRQQSLKHEMAKTTTAAVKPMMIQPEDVLAKSSSLKQKDIEMLMQKLDALEKRTTAMALSSSPSTPLSSSHHGGAGGVSMSPAPSRPVVIYTPLLVQDDDKFKSYFKLKAMNMPVEQIKAKMESEHVDPSLLDTPYATSPNDPGVRMYIYIYIYISVYPTSSNLSFLVLLLPSIMKSS
jgi:hypothetical protein